MDVQKFQRICEKSRFRILRKRPTKHGDILLAERCFPLFAAHKDHFDPHWQILWAVERNGADVGQIVYCKIMSTQENRVKLAVQTAKQWIEDNLDVGRYKH